MSISCHSSDKVMTDLQNRIIVDDRLVFVISSAENEFFRTEFRTIELKRTSANDKPSIDDVHVPWTLHYSERRLWLIHPMKSPKSKSSVWHLCSMADENCLPVRWNFFATNRWESLDVQRRYPRHHRRDEVRQNAFESAVHVRPNNEWFHPNHPWEKQFPSPDEIEWHECDSYGHPFVRDSP